MPKHDNDGFFATIGRVWRTYREATEEQRGWILGLLGSWSIRVVTLGYCRPSSESWGSIALGFVELVLLVIWGTA